MLGDKEIESGNITIEKRDGTKETKTLEEFISHLKNEISNRE